MSDEDEIITFNNVNELMATKVVPKDFELGSTAFDAVKNVVSDGGTNCGVLASADHLPQATKTAFVKKHGRLMRLVVANADENGNTLVEAGDNYGGTRPDPNSMAPSMSFACLARLLHKRSEQVHSLVNKAFEEVASGKIVVLDYTPDEKISIPHQYRRTEKQRKKLVPPAPGFTLVGGKEWHRPATVLLQRGTIRYVLGQDEGQYFGVELVGGPNTVQEAFDDMVPVEARGKKGIMRQGEWFAIPVEDKDVPAALGLITEIVLPKDAPDSQDHSVQANEIRIGNGCIYAQNFRMTHEEHKDITNRPGEDWYKFVHNTVVKSVSMQGVD